MIKMNSKELIKKSITVVIALFSFLMLFFSLINVKVWGASAGSNGFNFLKLGQLEGLLEILVGLLCYAHLLLSFVLIAASASAFFDVSKLTFAKYIPSTKQIVLASLGSAGVYFIEGILLIIRGNIQLDFSFGTAAFWPLIIIGLFVAGLWAVEQYLPEDFTFVSDDAEGTVSNEAPKASEAPKAAHTAPKTQNLSETERVELLTKYNDLLEKGIITQEEYDAKKKELLGL